MAEGSLRVSDLIAQLNTQRRAAKEERAKAMDQIVDLLLERGEARDLLARWVLIDPTPDPKLRLETVQHLTGES